MTIVIGSYDGAVQSDDDAPSPTGGRRRSPARARMVRSAATLIRERGIHGVGLREIVVHAGGPRGSLGRYFPSGKTQLVTEALDLAAAELSDEVAEALAEAETFPEAISAIVEPWRRLLIDHDFALGCPFAATIVDSAADNDELRRHVHDLLAQWQASVADTYVKFGELPAVVGEQSTVLLAALEGALILARARRSTEPLGTVERYFADRPPVSRAGA